MRRHNKGLLAIALFKWAKGLLFLALGLGFLRFLHRDIAGMLEHFAERLRIDPDNRFFDSVLAKVSSIDDKKIALLSTITFAYSALFLTEGTGLFFEKRWAEYLTIIATASLVPVEIYELIREPTVLKSLLVVVNILIVAFLIVIVRQQRKRN
jgi:uncharacterized membrane protein (DUF2068 family)